MPSHTVNLSHGAYLRLRRLKRPGESFSDVINRLTGQHALRGLVGILSPDEAKELEGHVRDFDRRFDAAARRRTEDLFGGRS